MPWHGRCCCPCQVVADNFNRDDNALDLGPNWEILDEGWSIAGNTARATQDLALHRSPLPDRLGSMVVRVDLVEPDYGDIFDVVLSAHDRDNFLFARFQAPADEFAPEYWRQGVGTRVAGVENIYWDDVEITAGCGTFQEAYLWKATRNVLVHFDRDVLEIGGSSVGFGHYGLWQCASRPGDPAQRAGLRHGGGPRAIRFDNFVASEHKRTNRTCPDYGCRCLWDRCMPDEFNLALTRIQGDVCDEIPAYLDIPLTRLRRGQSVWRSERVIECLGSVQEPSWRQFFLECLGHNRQGGILFRLWSAKSIYGSTPSICDLDTAALHGVGMIEWESVAQQCDPFLLIFREEAEVERSATFAECCWDPYEEPGYPGDPWIFEAVVTEPAE
jgi:hypothetical protein